MAAALSIVIASNGATGAVERCLGALEYQRDGAEVIVCSAEDETAARGRFGWARFERCEGRLVPELWRDGIRASSGQLVALTIGPMRPAPDWVDALRGSVAENAVAAGAIEPEPGVRIQDWAEYFVRYARDMLPFVARESLLIPGDNSAYPRELLDRTDALWAEGFWEPVVNGRLAEDGVALRQLPGLVVFHGRSAGMGAFLRQRFVHGRIFGQQRALALSRPSNLVHAASAPIVAALLTVRVVREVATRRRYRGRLALALPLVVAFDLAWAAGEGLGHLEQAVWR